MTDTSVRSGNLEPTFTVGDIAAAGGVAASAVRFYEQHGVIAAERTAGNQRRFHEAAGCRIQVAKLAQRVGLTVREIAELFHDLPTDPGPEDWDRIAGSLVAQAEERVADLRAQLEVLGSDETLCDVGSRLR